MIEVELPDGSIAEFPDGTPDDVMKGALQKRFGAPQAAPSPQMQTGLDELSAITQNPAAAQYEALPAWQKPIVAASDIAQLAGRAPLMGWGEKAVATGRSLVTGSDYEDELAEQRRLTEGARKRSGWAGTGAEVAGAVAGPLALANKGVSLAGRFGSGAATGAKGVAARSALMGVEGLGYGALGAAGEDQDILTGAGLGAVAGGAGNLIGEGISAGVDKVAGWFNKKPPKIGFDELKAQGDAAYNAADKSGVVFNQQGVTKLARDIFDDLTNRGYAPENEPGVAAFLKRFEQMSKSGNITIKGLDTLRKVASNGYRPGMKSNNAAVGEIVNRIDDLVNAADPGTILIGQGKSATEAATAYRKARDAWSKARKTETVQKLVERGELIGGSQKNQDVAGATRRQLRTILTNEGKGRGFTEAEKAAAKKAVLGSGGQRALDAASGMFPIGKLSGLAQGSLAAFNIATGNLPALGAQAAGAAAGYGAGKASEALGRRSVDEFVDLVARGGVPAQQSPNAVQLLARQKRDALSRALMALGVYETAR